MDALPQRSFVAALLVVTGLGFLVIPRLVTQSADSVDVVPKTSMTSLLGVGRSASARALLDRRPNSIADRKAGCGARARLSRLALGIAQSLVTAVVASSPSSSSPTSCFSRGRDDRRRARPAFRSRARSFERVGQEIYRTISEYLTGNLLISASLGIPAFVLFAVGSGYAHRARSRLVAHLRPHNVGRGNAGTIIVGGSYVLRDRLALGASSSWRC